MILTLAALASLSACGDSARSRQAHATATMTDEADRQVGMPALTNFSERRLMRDVYERRDRANATYAYFQSLDGKLICLGRAVGYGLPYGAQFTAPFDGHGRAQAEPNTLYMPDSASATWIQILNPQTNKVDVVYVEPNLVVSPFPISGPAVTAACE